MAVVLRFAVAMSMLPFLATSGLASPEIDAAFDLPSWAEPCSLPSVTASSSIVKDSAFRLASDDQPTADSTKSDVSGAGCSDCDSCGVCDCCCCCPQWYASAGALILHRVRPDGGNIAIPQVFGPAINAAGFGFGWNGGLDLYARRTCCCDGWDTRYFNDLGASANQNFAFFGEDFFIGGGSPTGVTNVFSTYATDLQSFEINHRQSLNNNITLLAGLRYLNVEDDLLFVLTVPAGSGRAIYSWAESNDLFGAQVGTDVFIWRGGALTLNSIFKGGVYGVAADNAFVNIPAAGAPITAGTFTGNLGFVGDINFLATYQLYQNVSLQGGYQLLWIDGLALASNQAVASAAVALAPGTDADGDLFYNGATAALVFTF